MAASNLQLQPPPNFDFKKPDEWSRWKRRYEQFTGLDKEEDAWRVSTLLYCLGEEAVLSTNITADEKKVYKDVIKKFDDYFQVRKNVIFERARFNRRAQHEGESAEQCSIRPSKDVRFQNL